MNPANREKVKDLLSRASRLPKGDRIAFIQRECAEDGRTAAEAIDLLATLDDADFLSAPTGVGFAAALSDSAISGEKPGAQIDRYKLLQLIGEGGFGSVYMAEQFEPVHRRVALKIIKAGMDTRQVIARFEAERQALAMMDHPNIARVLDAGATQAGRPYFVMELVRGEAVTAYCDHRQMAVRERLGLFRDVCNAVQHAHQKGIIHRDLKPSNVLVTVADGRPVPKVIDFGIAKATAARLTDKTLFTEMHQLMGTPEYMSPEQAEVAGVDIDTRSDVYSLGVLLYELLAGSTPLERERLRSTPLAEIQRLIREEEAPRPSLRLATMASTPASPTPLNVNDSSALDIARRRQTEPAILTRTLRGDLDWIVMKCLEKDRSRRYATASALADDVTRYLAEEPVLATPPSKGYRLQKFIRRNRTLVLAGASVAVVLWLGIIGSTIGFVQARQAEKLAIRKSAESAQQAAKAAAVSGFLQEMLASVDPEKALGKEVTIKQALDEAATKVETGTLQDQPAVEADLRGTIGTTYAALGLYPLAEKQLRAALALRRSLPTEEAAAGLAGDLGNLAGLVGAQGNHAEEEQCLREALAIMRRLHEGDHHSIASAEQGLAASLRIQGKLGEAEPHYRAALEMRQRLFGHEHADVAQSLNSLGLLAQNKGELAKAEELLGEALAIRRNVLGDPHPVVADALNNLANVLRVQGKFEEAEDLLRKALAMRQKLLGREHPAVAQSFYNLANVLWDKRDAFGAEPLYREAHDIWRQSLPANHPNITWALDGLSIVLVVQKKYAEAETHLRECLFAVESYSPRDELRILREKSLLGEAMAGQGRYEEAEGLLLATLEGFKEHPHEFLKNDTIRRLGILYEAWGRPDDAARWKVQLRDVKEPRI